MSKSSKQTPGQLTTAILEKESKRFLKFGNIKSAYSYFMSNYKVDITYDLFFYYYKKVFKIASPTKVQKLPKARPTKPSAVLPSMIEDVTIDEEKKEFHLKIYDPSKERLNPEIFVPIRTGQGIDVVISKKGGFMPGTTTVISGDAGTGKTTIVYSCIRNIQKLNPDKEIMVLSSEMARTDIEADFEEKPWLTEIKQILFEDYEPDQYKDLLEAVILHGYEFLGIDSFQDIIEKLEAFSYMSRKEATTFFFKLLKDANNGKTKTGHNTCIFLIQQVTKGGVFVGTNALKHNTTAMMHLAFSKSGERFITYFKNRRNGGVVMKRLFYFLDENGEIQYEMDRYNEEMEQEKLLKGEIKKSKESLESFNEIFLKSNSVEVGVDEFGSDFDMDDEEE